MVRLGIGSYTFGWASGAYSSAEISSTRSIPFLSAEDLIDTAVSLDVQVVQICDKPALDTLSAGELRGLADRARRHGIDIEVGTTGSDPDHLRRYVEIAERLESRLLRTLLGDPTQGFAKEQRQLEELIPALERSHVVLAIENHERYACQDLARLVQRLNSGSIGVCLDTVNSLGRGEGVREVVETLMGHARCLHVKDFTAVRGSANMGFSIVGAVAGQGRLDIPAQLEAFRAASPSGSVILEQWTPFGGSLEESIRVQEDWAKEGLRYLRRVADRRS
jgi:sugar phosphate isomerase/epimerase